MNFALFSSFFSLFIIIILLLQSPYCDFFCSLFFFLSFSFFFFFWGGGGIYYLLWGKGKMGRGINPLFYRYFPDKSTHIPNCAVYIFSSSESVISATWPRCPNCLLQIVWWQCKRCIRVIIILKIRLLYLWAYFDVDWEMHKKNGCQPFFYFFILFLFFYFFNSGFGWLCNISQIWKQKIVF